MSTTHDAIDGGESTMSTTKPKSQLYNDWFRNAIGLVRDGNYALEDVEAAELDVNDERARHCIELSLDAIDEEANEPSQADLATDPEEIDWQAVFDEFGFLDQSGYAGASITQLAGALAASEHTGYRAADSYSRKDMKDNVRDAVDQGVLEPNRAEGAIVGYLPAGGRGAEVSADD